MAINWTEAQVAELVAKVVAEMRSVYAGLVGVIPQGTLNIQANTEPYA